LDLIFRFREYLDSGKPFVSNGESDWALIDHESLTDFQRAVYKATLAIPHGETRTYGWIAQRIGRPLAARAVGQALRNNPLLIIVPCHRVVATTALGGFMGVSNPEEPEMRLKSRLIQIEGDYVNPLFPFLAGLTGGNEWARATA
jgi:methylated-DNA-[protein]-cysteine S-methyltransferase